MRAITRAQREAILKKYRQSPDGARSYREFRKRAFWTLGDFIALQWCGMYVGIEKDGYTHT